MAVVVVVVVVVCVCVCVRVCVCVLAWVCGGHRPSGGRKGRRAEKPEGLEAGFMCLLMCSQFRSRVQLQGVLTSASRAIREWPPGMCP